MSPLSRLGVFLIGVAACFAAMAQTPAPAPTRVRGAIEKFAHPLLTVKSRDGATVIIKLADTFTVSGVVPAKLSDITPGKYVGIAAKGPSDALVAIEVLIFPDPMRGTGEGHYPWDLLPESTMTNASVAEVVQDVRGTMLTLRYKDGEKKISVPADAPIVTFVPAERDVVQPGAKVFVTAQRQPDGALTAMRIAVGLNGLTPPM